MYFHTLSLLFCQAKAFFGARLSRTEKGPRMAVSVRSDALEKARAVIYIRGKGFLFGVLCYGLHDLPFRPGWWGVRASPKENGS